MTTVSSPIIFMTGASSGFGRIAALELASQGSTIIALVRNIQKGADVVKDFLTLYPNAKGKIELIEGNLNSFTSIVHACKAVKNKFPLLHQLVLNAGIMNFEARKSEDHIEETLQVNLLSHLLLIDLLLPCLYHAEQAKIIFTSSGLHQGEIHFDDLESKKKFTSYQVYRQSKLGVILASRFLAKKLAQKGILVVSQHPGMVRTALGKYAPWWARIIFYLMGKSTARGAENLIFLMKAQTKELETGAYYVDKQVVMSSPQSYDMIVAKKLMKVASEYINKFINLPASILR